MVVPPKTTMTPGLTRHTVLMAINKSKRALPLKAALENQGFEVRVVLSIYEAVEAIDEQLPHVVVSESVFDDGDVSVLRRKAQEQPLMAHLPFIAMLQRKIERELRPLKGFEWAGVLLGKQPPKVLVDGIMKSLRVHKGCSPYFATIEDLGLEGDTSVRFPATASGRYGDRIVFRSHTRIDREAILKCVPRNQTLQQVELHMAENLRYKSGYFNFFPFSQQRGPGRAWMRELHVLQEQNIPGRYQVLFQAPDEEIERWSQLLASYGIDLHGFCEFQEAVEKMKDTPRRYQAAVLFEREEAQMNQRLTVLKSLLALPERPTCIIVTPFAPTRVDPSIRFLADPFGFGQMVDALKAAFVRADDYRTLEDRDTDIVCCDLILDARILGLDEQGGIIETPFPLDTQSVMQIDHPSLVEFWGGDSNVKVISCKRNMKHWDLWQLQFVVDQAASSRGKYWRKLIETFPGKLSA